MSCSGIILDREDLNSSHEGGGPLYFNVNKRKLGWGCPDALKVSNPCFSLWQRFFLALKGVMFEAFRLHF